MADQPSANARRPEAELPTERCESCGQDTPLNAIDHGVCWRCRDLAGWPYDE